MEMVGAVLAVCLATKIKESLQMEFKETRYFTDSYAVLGILLRDSATFLEFVGTRVSEIKSKSTPDTEWYWVPGEQNLADMGTRPNVLPHKMDEGKPYQEWMQWMYQHPSEWPVKKNFEVPPPEEFCKDMTQAMCG